MNLEIKNLEKKKIKNQYSWEKEGKIIITEQKINLTLKEYNIIYKLLEKPIPDEIRKDYWLIITRAREKLIQNKNYYNTILNMFRNYIKIEHPIYKQIQKKIEIDVNRSFVKSIEDNEKNKLRNILSAFTVRNISLNYCQGFNQIVAKLLEITNFNEEESFWLFCSIIEEILPFDFYLTGIGIESDMEIINNIIKRDKNLNLFFEKNKSEYLISSSCAKWLISIFISGINKDLSNSILDIIFFFRGFNNIVNLYNATIIMFNFAKNLMGKDEGMEYVNNAILKLNNLEINDIQEKKNKLIERLLNGVINKNYINKLIFERRKIINAKMKRIPVLTPVENNKEISCLDDFNVCVKDLNYKNDVKDYIILSKKNILSNVKIIDDYYFDYNKQDNNNIDNINIDNNLLNENDILIQRKKHLCDIKHLY